MKTVLLCAFVPKKDYTVFFEELRKAFPDLFQLYIYSPFELSVQGRIVRKYLKDIDVFEIDKHRATIEEIVDNSKRELYKYVTYRDLMTTINVMNFAERIIVGFEPGDLVLYRFMNMIEYIKDHFNIPLKEYYTIPLSTNLYSMEHTAFRELDMIGKIVYGIKGISYFIRSIYYTTPKKYREKKTIRRLAGLIIRKYIPNHPEFKDLLLKTGNAHIYYTRRPYDRSFYPAYCNYYTSLGPNLWGRTLMLIRKILKNGDS